MRCPICDQKPMNCDCTENERKQFSEIGDLEDEIARLRLTEEEREAITIACGDSSQWSRPHVATLLRLLERTK